MKSQVISGTVVPSSAFAPIAGSLYSCASVPISSGATHTVLSLSGTPFIATLYGYGQGDGYGCPAGLALGGYSPGYLAVYATGANSTRLYWEGVPNASGYKIYRTLTPGQYDFTQPPLTIVSATTRLYDDTNLQNGQVYGYAIAPILPNGAYSISEEDIEIPNANAIPWNGTPTQILSSAWQVALRNPPAPAEDGSVAPQDPTNLRVMAPDGTIYDGANPTVALPRDAVPDVASGTYLFPDGSAEVASSLGGASPARDTLQTGAVRRMMTEQTYGATGNKYLGVSTFVSIPPANNTNFNYPPTAAGYVTPSLYIGIGDPSANSAAVDAGITFAPKDWPTQGLNARWNATLRITDGTVRKSNGYIDVPISRRENAPRTTSKFIDASSSDLNIVFFSFGIDPLSGACTFFIQAGSVSGVYYRYTLLAASKDTKPYADKVVNLSKVYRMKRVASVDQGVGYPIGRITGKFTNGSDQHYWGSFRGVVKDGLFMNNIIFFHTQLNAPIAGWIPWDTGLTAYILLQNGQKTNENTGGNIFNYDTRYLIGVPNDPVQLNPPGGNSISETISFHL